MHYNELSKAVTLLSCIGALGCSRSPAKHSVAEVEPIWSVALSQSQPLGDTSSDFAATRRAVIVEGRVVVLIDVGPTVYVDDRPKSTFRLLSLDLASGRVVNQQDLSGFSTPYLYATDDDHVIIGEFSLRRLNPDLTPTNEQFTEVGHGRTIQISPDGSTLAHETVPGTELLDSRTLLPTGTRLTESVPTAVSRGAVLTDNVHWIGQYPHDSAFVTLTDRFGQHLIFHGQCSGRPAFLDDTRALVTGCGKLRILDVSGRTLGEAMLPSKSGDFAGVSRDGSRFAIQDSEWRGGDPPQIRSERFTIYDSARIQPIAVIKSKLLPERRSWTAFSKDGHMFVVGSSARLSLFRIP
jgi:hypothetical protein